MNDQLSESTEAKRFMPLRVWPAILLLVAMAGAKSIPFFVQDESMAILMASIMGPLVAGVLIVVWWIAMSRATILERIVGFMGVVIAGVVAAILSDTTMLGPGLILLGVPIGTAAFGIVTVLLGRVLSFKRTIVAILAAICGFGFITLLRNDGMWGDGHMGLTWRWEKSPEEVLLASREANAPSDSNRFTDQEFESWLREPEWPQFRGPNSNSQQSGPTFATDWSTAKPKQEWKIAIGPGWSSFAVAGNLLFTQEQLGEYETVACYAADSGEEIWKQQLNERFFDPMGGPGPRATPTLSNGMLFAQSAMGEVQRLNPITGELVWSKDIKQIANCDPPAWGFSSSPLVIGDNVIVFAGGEADKGVLAFDVESGDLNWNSEAGGHSYSSPQLESFGGRDCVLMLSNFGLNIIDPDSGAQLLSYEWPHSGYRATQPQVVDGYSVILPTQELGTRRIRLETLDTSTPNESVFSAKEEWTSRQLKPDFNDFVIFENNAYGFDGRFFICIDLATGKRNWKGGRYGKGQVLLLKDSGLLLVISEKGEAVLLKADPTSRQELAKFQALEGRTWNHPVVIGDRLYIRNSQEAACYILPTLDSTN